MGNVQLPIHPLFPFVLILARMYYASTVFGVTVYRLSDHNIQGGQYVFILSR